ncbi:MAG: hypothetical protein GEV09_11220 [Pseudonocardiaceae bacterium]|nr:hypothetical protein [Pseudonocardiaceae bacterium]
MGITVEIVNLMGRAGSALESLPLAELPDITTMHIRGALSPPLSVELELGAGDHQTARLLAWADALPGVTASARRHRHYVRVEAAAVVNGVPLAVQNHFTDITAMDVASDALGLPRAGTSDVPVSLTALWRLAGRDLGEVNRHG